MDAEGRSFEELASLVVAGSEARAGSSAVAEFANAPEAAAVRPAAVLRVTE